MKHSPRIHSAVQRLLQGGLLVGLSAAVVQAQQAPVPSYELRLPFDSGLVANTGSRSEVIISKTVHVEGADWLRLAFTNVQLSGDVEAGTGSILRITSFEDGYVQELNAVHVAQWQNTSAYFNGGTLQVEIEAQPGTGDNRLVLGSVTASLSGTIESQCGPQDNRVLSNDPRSARVLPVGCSVWMFDDCNHCFGTAGHCSGSSLSVVQFNVPASSSNGSLNNPPPQHQYTVDPVSRQSLNGGIGNDWGYFGVFPNSNTGLTPFQSQGQAYHLASPPPFNGSNTIRITGYGTDSSPLTANQVQQTHVGPWAHHTSTQLGYQTDTTGGNSGSPVIHEQTGNVIGVHTHGGCDTGGGGSNSGTASNHGTWQAALNNPKGVCIPVASSSTYCTAKLNSAGCLPTISSAGSPTTTGGAGTFSINSSAQLSGQNGLLLYGTLPAATPFAGGVLCVGGTLVRTAAQNSGGTVGCTGSFTFDMGAWIASGIDPSLECGAIVYTQYWARDTGFLPPNNASLTQGLKFTIGG
jgi:V8-like Glu-specific endopeptidase